MGIATVFGLCHYTSYNHSLNKKCGDIFNVHIRTTGVLPHLNLRALDFNLVTCYPVALPRHSPVIMTEKHHGSAMLHKILISYCVLLGR